MNHRAHNERVVQAMKAQAEFVLVEGTKFFMRAAHGATVRRTTSGPGTPVKTGEAKSGNRVGLNAPPTHVPPPEAPFYPVAGSDHVDGVLATMQAGDIAYHGNLVPYANILEGGRRFSEKAGKMLGSVQAPKGFYKQAFDHGLEAVKKWNGTS